MTDRTRFLQLAALELIQQESLRVVKAPPAPDISMTWMPGWEDWDEVLIGDGPGTRPSIFVFANPRQPDYDSLRRLYDGLVARITGGELARSPQPIPLRLVVVLCFDSIDSSLARRLSRMVPEQYYANLKPEVWVVDLFQGRLWAPKVIGLISSRAQIAVKRALDATVRGEGPVGEVDLAQAEATARAHRTAFVSTLQRNVPYVTYALLAACWIVFAFESGYPGGSMANATLLHFGALQPKLIEQGQWWRLFTAMFVHVGIAHIFFNSIALYSVGSLVERIYGAVRYAIIYFVSGLCASAASFAYFVLITKQTDEIAAGASGAIFGIAGVLIVLGVLRHSLVPRALALQLSVYMGILIVLNLTFDYFSPGIDIRAHIGGLVVGLILGYFLAPRAPTAQARELGLHSRA